MTAKPETEQEIVLELKRLHGRIEMAQGIRDTARDEVRHLMARRTRYRNKLQLLRLKS